MLKVLLATAGLLITLSLSPTAFAQAAPAGAVPAAAPVVTASADSTGLPVVVAARVTTTPDRGRLILDLSAPAKFAVTALASPPRIAVDVAAGSLKFDTPQPPAGTGLITSYMVGMADAGRARATLMLSEPAQVQQAYVLDAFADQPARLVIDLVPTTADAFAQKAAADAAAASATAPPLAASSTPPGETAVIGPVTNGTAPAAQTAPASPPAATSTSVAAPSADTAALAPSTDTTAQAAPPAQAPAADASQATAAPAPPPATSPGKARPLIVLDPGHGGIDSGARAPNGVMEKNIVLAVALKLQALLVKTGRFDVALTRTDDSYLTLEQRVQLARQNKADLFISIHADTFQQAQIRGTSIYTRDEQATDVLDKVLADNENKFDIVAGFAVPKMNDQVVDALVDLMRRQMRKQSFIAAESIVHALQPSFELRRFPVRAADFFVLQAPDVPSMLIELGFLSNAEDVKNLVDPAWQDRAVAALARGISAYFDGAAP